MTQEEYNRIKKYERIEYNIEILRNAILALDADSVIASRWSDIEKRKVVFDALTLCQDRFSDVFRTKMYELIAERDKI